jgi:hypothetical protein
MDWIAKSDTSRALPPLLRASMRIRYGDGDGADEVMWAMRGWPLAERMVLDPWLDLADAVRMLQDRVEDPWREQIRRAALVRGATIDIVEVDHDR